MRIVRYPLSKDIMQRLIARRDGGRRLAFPAMCGNFKLGLGKQRKCVWICFYICRNALKQSLEVLQHPAHSVIFEASPIKFNFEGQLVALIRCKSRGKVGKFV